MTSSRWAERGSGEKWSKFRRKWMVTGGGGGGRGSAPPPPPPPPPGIRRYWMSRAMISISVIRVLFKVLFQTGVWLCYRCSRQVSGSAISVPDRCLVLF